MSSPFVAEIRMWGLNFAPTGWAQCFGQLMPISQNTALFSLLGTFYGGDGKSTFALPNLGGNVPLHQGQSTTGTQYFLGQESGSQFVTLLQSEMPIHTHVFNAMNEDATTADPSNAVFAKGSWTFQGNGGVVAQYSVNTPSTMMNVQAASIAGASLPHNNMMNTLFLTFCIALQGVFPARP